MRDELTVREREVLDYIIEYRKTNGFPPTLREIARGINTKSFQHVTFMIEKLREKGYITYRDKSPRTIRVLRDR